MSILVTGGLGYIGSHVVKMLLDQGEDVVIVDNLSTGNIESKPDNVALYTCDIGNIPDLVFTTYYIEAVVHLAALADVGDSVLHPSRYYENNVVQGYKLLESMLRNGCRRMIFSSSAAVYGDPLASVIEEHRPKSPTNPYGRSKLMFEQMLREYWKAYSISSISLRYFNAAGAAPDGTIGEKHNQEHHIIPLLLSGKPFTVFGEDWTTPDGTCIRDYVHVSDIALAHILALNKLRLGKMCEEVNLGNSRGYSVLDVIKTVEEVTGNRIDYTVGMPRPGDPEILVASNSKAKEFLQWEPEYPDLRTMIQHAWEWECGGKRLWI